jgi:hypothetical protein
MDIINGFIENVRVVPTTIDTHMITFVLNGERCKAFNDLARMIETNEGQEVQAEGFWRPYRDERELDVRGIKYRNAAGRYVTVVE